MLQQTRVGAIGDRFARFVARFPDPRALAAASEDDILAQWSGLGYYARARNLRRAAQKIVAEQGGAFPRAREDILALPGVGASTAAAIGVFAFGRKEAILDGNVKRVLARVFGDCAVIDRADGVARLWRLAASCAARADDIRAYTQGVMDLGATVCRPKNPLCEKCPLANLCRAKKDGAQASLPRKSAKKPRPQKTIGVAVVARADRIGFSILLQKRPARGIWGGLWSPLETAPAPDLTFAPRAAAFAGEDQGGGNRIARRSAGARFARNRARIHSFSARFIAGFVFRHRRRKHRAALAAARRNRFRAAVRTRRAPFARA